MCGLWAEHPGATFALFLHWDIWLCHCQKEEQSYVLQKVLQADSVWKSL